MAVLEVSDDRHVEYEVVGDPKGVPVFFQHGTGDSRLCKHPDDSVTAGLGVRLITADRPGVGGSSPHKGRSILDWVPDVEKIADELTVEKFVVAGHSGGSPHALAIALGLGDRVTKVGLAAPIAPFDQEGTKGMVKDKDLKMIFKLAHVKWLVAVMGKVEAKHYRKDIHGFVAILDPGMSDRLTKRLPDCTEHTWKGAGHYGVYGRWEEFLGALV